MLQCRSWSGAPLREDGVEEAQDQCQPRRRLPASLGLGRACGGVCRVSLVEPFLDAFADPLGDTLANPAEDGAADLAEDATADHDLPIGVVVIFRSTMLRMLMPGIR